ncbi:hypothetical protein DL767_003246 [Monosporascus sp. MG133]|nr:hypothetical protein DL767_003246 [Monosporascus sp. MG133]
MTLIIATTLRVCHQDDAGHEVREQDRFAGDARARMNSSTASTTRESATKMVAIAAYCYSVERRLPKKVYLVEPTEAELPVVKTWIDHGVDALRVQHLLDDSPLRRPLHLLGKQGAPVLSDAQPSLHRGTLLLRAHTIPAIRRRCLGWVSQVEEGYDLFRPAHLRRRITYAVEVVDEASACIPGLDRILLAANHSEMNKYSGPDDRSFRSVAVELRRTCERAPAVVRPRAQHALTERPEAKECLRDLFPTDPYEDRKALRRKKGGRAKGTCDWILGTAELMAWLSDAAESTSRPTEVLWLHGNPGSGKSGMSMFLAEALPDVFSKTPNKTLAYFFYDSGYDTRTTATAVMRGLLLQLAQQHPRQIEHVLRKHKKRKARSFHSSEAVWAMFITACADKATGPELNYVIFNDALDECEQDEQEMLLKQIEKTFGRDRSGGGGLNVSLLITSRLYLEIDGYLRRFPHEDLSSFGESRQDIDNFIDDKVAKLRDMKN